MGFINRRGLADAHWSVLVLVVAGTAFVLGRISAQYNVTVSLDPVEDPLVVPNLDSETLERNPLSIPGVSASEISNVDDLVISPESENEPTPDLGGTWIAGGPTTQDTGAPSLEDVWGPAGGQPEPVDGGDAIVILNPAPTEASGSPALGGSWSAEAAPSTEEIEIYFEEIDGVLLLGRMWQDPERIIQAAIQGALQGNHNDLQGLLRANTSALSQLQQTTPPDGCLDYHRALIAMLKMSVRHLSRWGEDDPNALTSSADELQTLLGQRQVLDAMALRIRQQHGL